MIFSVDSDILGKVIGQLLGEAVETIEPISGGRNSRIYKVLASDGQRYVAKQYYGKTMEGRDRLKIETESLRFLRDHGETAVPKPIAADKTNQVALFNFIDGDQVTNPTYADIDQLSNFLLRLDRLSLHPDSRRQPNASEACFSLSTIVEHIVKRLERFDAITSDSQEHQALRDFLANRFRPALRAFSIGAEKMARTAGIHFSQPIPDQERVLSPSDTGFHNALRERAGVGRIVFLDFEYFGWDDPGKMIADVLLHPGMDLTFEHKKRFIKTMLHSFTETRPYLSARVAALYKLVGLKWITILLNEFVGSDRARRKFAVEGNAVEQWKDESQILRVQLGRAEELLDSLYNEKNETISFLCL